MLFHIILLLIFSLASATPPACFLDCINRLSHICAKNQADIRCLCQIHQAVNQCSHRFCLREDFLSARDHFAGTCIEHGLEFSMSGFEADGFLDDTSEDESDLDYDIETDNYMSTDEKDIDYEAIESTEESVDENGNELDISSDWSEGETFLEGEDWPEENEIDLSELNKNIVKNYMNYFLKQKPSPRTRMGTLGEISNSGHNLAVTKKLNRKPYIANEPTGHITPRSKEAVQRTEARKNRNRKYESGFDREKQDQILYKRF
ncbi:hypothetical protein METBIDRAFT_212589 [Metschnikowia bicuspidata var. bicuspidata NRRL YB-4993]|uniref:CFEM domain-containing protein n=1 Tax=Metschnikowia bicuspidata var. bicuspidata NRRL YB-4993 TaxID=869754 RepID=A0A1A0H862_9ASCO|nr:hypothetical protein METBIDRAFT_212589 [Metschnikowia bicuspidata var. bicuspidata NRRL YB-4993]OBA20083.1 hypothetical protein METBIDRAFT_212589 [Metschnikowia bicuspidata var. bicuspidata NRRL YB-4993]